MITATTMIGTTTTTAIENLPGTTERGRETVPRGVGDFQSRIIQVSFVKGTAFRPYI